MLKKEWKKTLLREKVMFISGIFLILSIPLSLITLYFMPISTTFFVTTVFYNLYKSMQMSNLTISKAIETDIQKGKKELQEGKISGAIMITALPLAIGMGIPMVFTLLIYLWIAI